jgi:hypothetical protein
MRPATTAALLIEARQQQQQQQQLGVATVVGLAMSSNGVSSSATTITI